ncbi:toprim domain-containing protein [Spirosoma sp. BT702]|uniref:Toprim domain-containing protein n=1 Tax=Spirosoma profusum TaxID=2771354 RepID=A0A926XZY2_9BACT|nr:toprim domain-containing protein [Spirosoma profusum]MBD2703366.1 toprim domain-containing protein [Spirosoma profusum]
MTKFDELRERFPNLIPLQELRANVSIIELALQYGYEPQRQKGKSRPVLENVQYNDKIIIKNPQDAAQQVYQRAGDFTDSGTVIDFIRNRLTTVFSTFNRPTEHEFKNVISVLYDYLRVDPSLVARNRQTAVTLSDDKPKQAFAKEIFDIRPLEAGNYLTSRQIAPQTISSPEFVNKVVAQISYFDPEKGQSESFMTVKEHPERNYVTFSNVAFPYYNGLSTEVTGLELRNENVKLHAAGSDRYSSVFISNPPQKPAQFFILESGIDVLSHKQLRTIQGDDQFNAVYFSTGGQLTAQQVNTITRYIASFDKAPDWKINLAFDNDSKGHLFDLQFIQQLSATKFPLTSTVAGINRIGYLLPEQDASRSIREALLDRIETYNKSVQAQFSPEADPLAKKELNGQLITLGYNQGQIVLNIPEAVGPLSAVSKTLLELTQLDQRIQISKSFTKDYNLELTREITLGKKFGFVIKDETGMELLNGNSIAKMARSFQQFKNQAETEGFTGSFGLYQRTEFGFLTSLAELTLEQGKSVKSIQNPALDGLVQAEKKLASQHLKSGGVAEPTPTQKTAVKP